MVHTQRKRSIIQKKMLQSEAEEAVSKSPVKDSDCRRKYKISFNSQQQRERKGKKKNEQAL